MGNTQAQFSWSTKPTKGNHHPAPPYGEMPAFMQQLRPHQAHGVAAIQLEIGILVHLRPNKELRLIKWEEIDWDGRILNVPAWRMKNKQPFRVPLPDRVMELFRRLEEQSNGSPYVFTGHSQEPLAERGMILLLRETMKVSKEVADVHGLCRTTFRSFCKAKKFNYVASALCLSHNVGTSVEHAYDWGTDLLDERRTILEQWASYIG
jgi:integrase